MKSPLHLVRSDEAPTAASLRAQAEALAAQNIRTAHALIDELWRLSAEIVLDGRDYQPGALEIIRPLLLPLSQASARLNHFGVRK